MKRDFVKPELTIVHVEMNDIIATSGGAGGTIPDAPFQSRGLGDWEDED